jgi:hypothetical protein
MACRVLDDLRLQGFGDEPREAFVEPHADPPHAFRAQADRLLVRRLAVPLGVDVGAAGQDEAVQHP